MSFGLHQGVHFCIANDQLTFLDLNSGRYSSLSGVTYEAFRKLADNVPLGDADLDALDLLVDRKLLCRIERNSPPLMPTEFSMPDTDLPDPPRHFHWRLTARALASQAWVGWQMRRRPLSQMLSGTAVFKPPAPDRQASFQDIVTAATAFQNTRMLVTTQDQCLNWSLAMRLYLSGLCIGANLVVGVRRTPWSAHAWVQKDRLLLSDSLDHVRQYTPILVV
ncbi:lasso peptide biosynthesis B2 protein [Asticcacaulis sp.]|uniref:lasso peptide biosynthesis B2 protein n=1 Tax=Asticcacaulis sp. TaxID=1872648 RepID=UPI002C9F185F|nr:lasso peptide biosynthesis B2 protein [Asticcacaulis sp.]HTM82194.1 lasso peptide biosynthesis B2 protein [Asticcacaulis sp.]